jgi:hypothetical protein
MGVGSIKDGRRKYGRGKFEVLKMGEGRGKS